MDIEKLIEQLRKSADFEDYPIVASFAAIIEKKYLGEAATALTALHGENEKLRGKLEYEQEHANAYYEECGQWEAENEKLRADVIRFNDLLASYQNVLVPELRSELEQVTLENNALWTYIEIVDREYRRYMDRGYIDKLDELKKVWKHGQGGRA